jgi:two-component system sensor kinase FixL
MEFWQKGAVRRVVDHAWFGYAIAILASALGYEIRVILSPMLDNYAVFLFMMPAVLLSMVYGGGPGLLATALGLGGGLRVADLENLHSWGIWLSAGMFVLLGLGSSATGEWLRRARKHSNQSMSTAREQQAHLESILATVPDAMIIIDDKGVVQSFSPAAERQFGWTAGEIIGRNVKTLMPSPYREGHDGYIERYRATGERRIIGIGRVVVGERKDGSTFPMELSVGEMPGTKRFFAGFVRDLTERQEAERRLQELQSELVHISRLSAMGEMASTLAHELNQPLSAVANYLNGSRTLLETESFDRSRLKDALDKATGQTLRAGQIIRRLRDFVERGETERAPEKLTKLIEEASALALVGAKQQNVRVRFQFAPSVDLVLVDKVQIQQVALNIIRNALDAMEKSDRRELLITIEQHDDDQALVSIADTGPGISPDVREQLFQPFVTTKRTGMGVGLSISRTIIESHGGRIWAEPREGGGTVFKFTLRIMKTEDVDYDS